MTSYSFPIEISPFARWVVEFDYSPGSPGCHTQRNGDPGWPDAPEEFEITDMQLEIRIEGQPWKKTEISLDESLANIDYIQTLCEAEVARQQDAYFAGLDEAKAEQWELSRE